MSSLEVVASELLKGNASQSLDRALDRLSDAQWDYLIELLIPKFAALWSGLE